MIDLKTDREFEKALMEFEVNHFNAFWRWRKITSAPGPDFHKTSNDELSERIKRLLLFYLTYGEIQDFRNMKHVLYVFYNTAVMRYTDQEKNPPVIEFPFFGWS